MPSPSSSRTRHRIRLAAWLAVLAVLCALRGPVQSFADRMVTRWSARDAILAWGLPPTRDNIDLYLSSHYSRPAPTPFPSDPDLPAIPDATPFSTNWCYGDLFQDGRLSIGVFVLAPSAPATLQELAGDHPAGPGKTVMLRLLHSRRELVEAFACDGIVLYFGHANFGKGIVFDHRSGEAPIAMGRDTLLVPENHLAPSDEVLERLDNGLVRIRGGCQGLQELNVQCKVFGYLGCRTDTYFRDIWQSHCPRVDFVATTYVSHTVDSAPDILRCWISGLQHGESLATIVGNMNKDQSAAILFGRMNETGRYHNPDNHSDRLYTY